MPGPFLIGQRVQLRPFEEEDAPLLTEWINDPEIRRYLPARRFPMSIQNEKDWIASMHPRQGTPQDLAMGIELRRGRRLIGSVGLHMIDWIHRRAMSGSFIGPPTLRGRGYGTEAKLLLLGHAFADLGLESIWSFVLRDNEPSIRALKKQGYQENGIFRRAALVAGQWKDFVYFDLLREEWEKLHGAKFVPAVRRRTRRPA